MFSCLCVIQIGVSVLLATIKTYGVVHTKFTEKALWYPRRLNAYRVIKSAVVIQQISLLFAF